jgi:bifunctional DNA-binding transcriptional regulator/antitoxin component of YhaV-PrlF toxin-antitoxin module
MVKVKLVDNFEDELYISPDIQHDYKILSHKMPVYFGQWNKKMKVITNDFLPEGTIVLPKRLGELFTIPLGLPYELIVTDGKLIIGPVIAYLVKKRKSNLTIRSLKKYSSRFKDYQNINGLIYISAADGIDINNKTIEGYYYNPHALDDKDRWVSGTFPYPGAIYKKITLPESVQNDLQDTIGDRIFNSNFFNKWQLYTTLSSNKITKQFVPETRVLKEFCDLEEMLKKHSTIYMKPLGGMQGKGIFVISKTLKGVKVVDRRKNEHHFNSIQEAEKLISNHIGNRKYLIQQGVPTTFKKQNVDFRLYMQKSHSKEWICQGIVGRFAKKKSIITNLKFVDSLLTGHTAIKKLFQVKDKEASKITDQMISAGIEICRLLDKEVGHFGDVAIDMIIDHNRQIWVLEINNRTYGMKSLQLMKEGEKFTKIKTTPFEYAKALAGFI